MKKETLEANLENRVKFHLALALVPRLPVMDQDARRE